MRLLGLTIAMLLVPAANAAEDDPPYSWTCKAQGYYRMEVSPDGRVTPIVDTKSLTQPISIVIKKRSKEGQQLMSDWGHFMVFPYNDEFVVSLTGGPVTVFTTPPDERASENRAARLFFSDGKLYEVSAIYMNGYSPVILTLKPADKDWVFSVHSGDLTSDSEARHMNIRMPAMPWGPNKAEAGVSFMTGPCVRN